MFFGFMYVNLKFEVEGKVSIFLVGRFGLFSSIRGSCI